MLWCFGALQALSLPYCDTCEDAARCLEVMRARDAARTPLPQCYGSWSTCPPEGGGCPHYTGCYHAENDKVRGV